MAAVPAAPDAPPAANVTPWEVTGDVDYEKLIREFGCSPIDDELLRRFERVTKRRPHHFLRRGIFFSHRDLARVLDAHERGEPWYLYTGRGPSSESMHMGHLVPFLFTKWLQDTFDVPLVIQITDDEKFYFKDLSVEAVERLAVENIRDIIAFGFRKERTFIFRDFEYVGNMYRTIARIERATTASQVKGIFGFQPDDNVGRWMFPAIQAAPSFSVCFPHIFPNPAKPALCLIPQAIDQDPYFRLTRDVAPRLGYLKPALIHSKFFPALSGPGGKMSSSVGAAVFLTDTQKQVKDKINKHAFSGGGATKEEQLELGGLCSVDVPIQWLSFFLEDDDEYRTVCERYASGRMMTGEVKTLLSATLWQIISAHQTARAAVSNDDIAAYCAIRPMHAS